MGKSTIVSLLARFYDPGSGRILFGKSDVQSLSLDQVSAATSMVLQDVHFFNLSVAENLRMARLGANDQELWDALAKACYDDVVRKLPNGLDTLLGDNACLLSGGERRRLAVARALLKDAPIVVLDEATASLDPENEHKLQQSFQTLARNKTLLVIAHRLTTIADAHTILFLKNGRIREQGNLSELLVANGRFATFWKLQNETQS